MPLIQNLVWKLVPRLMNKLQLWRKVTTSLIGGDRFDVTTLDTNWIDGPNIPNIR